MRRLTDQHKHEAARIARIEAGRLRNYESTLDFCEPISEAAEEHKIGPELEAELRESHERRTSEKERRREARVLVEGDIVTIDGITRQLQSTAMVGWGKFAYRFDGYEITTFEFRQLVALGRAKRITCHNHECLACGNAKHRRNVFELLRELDRWLQD